MSVRYNYPGRQMVIGAAFGYSRAAHAMGDACAQAGGIEDPEADLVVTFTSPSVFRPALGKFNVLFTMTESEWMAPWLLPGIQAADALIVPCEWNARLLRRFTRAPVYVCPLGVFDTFLQGGVDRESPQGRPFRFFWLGAHNQRKGWTQIYEAWLRAFVKRDDVELYMKTTSNPDDRQPIGVKKQQNIVIDNRVLSEEALYELYVRADAFVFPSWGEGWGLPLAEAMATALPCLTTLHSGMLEFADATVVRPIAHETAIVQVHAPDGFLHYEPMSAPRVDSLVDGLHWMRTQWKPARKMGHRAWRRMQGFSWPAAGEKLLAILREIDAARVRLP